MRKIYFGCVDDLFAGLVAACYADGLGVMASFHAAGAAGFAGLRSATIGGLREFGAGIIDDIPLRARRQRSRVELCDLVGNENGNDEQQAFGEPCEENSAIGENADRRFSGEGFGRTHERRAEGSFEFLPRRRPFDEQAWWIGPLDCGVGNCGNGGYFSHSSDNASMLPEFPSLVVPGFVSV